MKGMPVIRVRGSKRAALLAAVGALAAAASVLGAGQALAALGPRLAFRS